MGFFGIKVGVTVTDRSRIAGITKRIQILNTRTVDSHVIIESKIGSHAQHIRNIDCRNDIIEVCAEITLWHQVVFHIHEGMLVSYTCLEPPFAQFQLIVGIRCKDISVLFKLTALIHILDASLTFVFIEHFTVAGIVSVDIFAAEIDIMLFRDRVYIINLCRMFRRVRIVIVILIAQREGDLE